MKAILTSVLFIASLNLPFAKTQSNSTVLKDIYTVDECKIQMTSKYVFANLSNKSVKIECTFNLHNLGDETKIQVGIPEMNFNNWGFNHYSPTDKKQFEVYVDGRLLSEKEIHVPTEMATVYRKCLSVYYYDEEYQRKKDSIYIANGVKEVRNGTKYSPGTYERTTKAMQELFEWRQCKPVFGSKLSTEFEELKEKENYPWYTWQVKFNTQEKKQIKIIYSLPPKNKNGAHHRTFNYKLESGSGWNKSTEKAEIKIQINKNIIKNIEKISPENYKIDSTLKTITWTFIDIMPTKNDLISVQYYNARERRKRERHGRKLNRKMR